MNSSGKNELREPPKFIINLRNTIPTSGNGLVTDYTNVNDAIYYMDIPDGQASYTLYAVAQSGMRPCDYTWYYKESEKASGYSSITDKPYITYRQVSYEEAQNYPYALLYELKEDDNTHELIWSGEIESMQGLDQKDFDDKIYAFRTSELNINKPGYYKVTSNVTTSTSSAVATSDIIGVPYPVTPYIKSINNNENDGSQNYISVYLKHDEDCALQVEVDKDVTMQSKPYDESNVTKY
jgi:hypothetical protein